MRTLVIDTASEACSVALFDGDCLIDAANRIIGRGHAEQLLPMIAALDGGGRSDQIWVGCGPGSFTGLRVGIAAARALGIGWGASVSGFSSLALVAATAAPGEQALVVMEGGHGEWFVQPFGADGEALTPHRSVRPEAAGEEMTPLAIGNRAEALVAQRGFGSARAALPDARAARAIPPGQRDWLPQPIYGRAPDAAVQRT